MDNYMEIVLKEIRVKKYLIVFLTILCGLVVGVERTYFHTSVPQTSEYQIEYLIKLTYDKPNLSGNEVNYAGLLSSSSVMTPFLINSETQFEYNLFNANWPAYSSPKKLEWLQSHMLFQNIDGGMFKIIFRLPAEEPKDLSYTAENGALFIDAYYDYAGNFLKEILPISDIEKVKSLEVLPHKIEISKAHQFQKYSFVGAFLGLLIGISITLAISLRVYRNGRK